MQSTTNYLNDFIHDSESSSANTARTYKGWLRSFERFAEAKFGKSVNDLIDGIKNREYDVYRVLSAYTHFLQEEGNDLSENTVREMVITARQLLIYADIELNPIKFKAKVKLPRKVKTEKKPISAEDVRKILLACQEPRLKSYILFVAGTGMRAVEALSIRVGDIDFNSNPVKVDVRAKYTKTKVGRHAYLTTECVKHLNDWLAYKYRKRRISSYDENGKAVSSYHTPTRKKDDLLFGAQNKPATPDGLYTEASRQFARLLDQIGLSAREENGRRREITLHSFRRLVKTTLSNNGHLEFSEWFIGHSVSTYWRAKEEDKIELFRKLEPYLTYLDFTVLEAKGADIETKLEEKDDQIRELFAKVQSMQNYLDYLAHREDQRREAEHGDFQLESPSSPQ